jgi:hypothetical protein
MYPTGIPICIVWYRLSFSRQRDGTNYVFQHPIRHAQHFGAPRVCVDCDSGIIASFREEEKVYKGTLSIAYHTTLVEH